MLALLAALALSLPTQGTPGAVLYCPDGIYTLPGPLPLKVFKKGRLLKLALPYRRPDWRLTVRYRFVRAEIVREVLKKPRPFPKTQIALVRICMKGPQGWSCVERPKKDLKTHWDEKSRTLWIFLEQRGPLEAVEVRLVFGEGECGGYLLYEKDGLPY